jgi:Tfp pilus tip-associated adhesin PilY1
LIAGNGYNSTDGKAVLYIFIINADGSLSAIKKLDTGAAGDNGLSGPAFIDTDKNGTADAVFAGDLKGNVWKFDISDKDPNVWNVAFTNTPLFKAVNASNQAQPITAPVYTAKTLLMETLISENISCFSVLVLTFKLGMQTILKSKAGTALPMTQLR